MYVAINKQKKHHQIHPTKMAPSRKGSPEGSPIKYIRKIFRKANISNPLIRTRTCAYQGVRNVSFSENFAYVLYGCPLNAIWKWWHLTKMAHDKYSSWNRQIWYPQKWCSTKMAHLAKIMSRGNLPRLSRVIFKKKLLNLLHYLDLVPSFFVRCHFCVVPFMLGEHICEAIFLIRVPFL